MLKLVKLMLVALLITQFITARDQTLSYRYRRKEKDILLTIFLILILGVFTGLRTFYNDTITYIQMYERAPLLSEFWASPDVKFSAGIGFLYVNSLLKTLGASTQDFIMVYGIVTMALYISFLRRYSTKSFTFSVYLLFATGVFVFAQAAIKQALAIGIGCFAVHYAIRKEWIKYILLVVLASLFHPYALIYLLIYFMDFKPWTGKCYLIIAVFLIAGLRLERMLGTIVDITSMMGASYETEVFIGEGVNIFRVFVCLVPTALTFLYKRIIWHHSSREENIFMNLAMLNGLIMFVGIFGTANYFARLANYFLIMQTIALPIILSKIPGKDGRLLRVLAIMGYGVYFYYESSILRPFDESFAQISLWTYLRGLL